MKEIWKDIPGYEGKYQVSNLGRVKSLDMVIKIHGNRPFTKAGRIKKLTKGNHGYYVVNLGLADLHTVHSLVMSAFVGPRKGKHIDHINSIRTDNRIENLQYVTQAENNAKQKFHYGENNYAAKLTNKEAIHIRDEYYRSGYYRGAITDIARGYRVSVAIVRDIVRNKTWVNVR